MKKKIYYKEYYESKILKYLVQNSRINYFKLVKLIKIDYYKRNVYFTEQFKSISNKNIKIFSSNSRINYLKLIIMNGMFILQNSSNQYQIKILKYLVQNSQINYFKLMKLIFQIL